MSNQGEKAGVAPSALQVDPKETIFAKMTRGEIKPKIVLENDSVLVFEDLSPQAPTHLLIVSKTVQVGQVHHASAEHAAELGKLFLAAGEAAKKLGFDNELESGYRLVINQGVQAQQSVNYLHIHMLAGRKFTWPPG